MHIVTKDNSQQIRQLSLSERQSLINVFTADSSSDAELALSQSVLNEAKTFDAWILCDCRPECYLFPRRTDTSITLVRPRPPRQHSHSKDCPFFLPELDNVQTPVTSDTQSAEEITNFCLVRPEKTASKVSVTEPASRPITTSRNLPSLTRVLFTLIQHAKLNENDSKYPFGHHFLSIYNAARSIPIWPGSKHNLSEVISTLTSESHIFALYKRLRTLDFKSDHKVQGYAISLASSADEYSVTLTFGQNIRVMGKVSMPSRTHTGPYWVIFLITEPKDGSGYFEPVRASLWPAYSETLPFPVDSDPERHTFKELLSWRLYWQGKGESFTIAKPLDFSSKVRPDFLVIDPDSGNTVVIETMGSEDGNYLASKIRMHGEMKSQYGTVIEHRVGDDSLSFKKTITRNLLK